MNSLEIAQKYGVPTLETSGGLDWKGETVYSWYFDYSTETEILIHETENTLGLNFIAKAPQMHEIAPLLVLDNDKYQEPELTLEGDYLYYSCPEPMQQQKFKYIEAYIENHHYAEAYAQLYLKLKNEGLL